MKILFLSAIVLLLSISRVFAASTQYSETASVLDKEINARIDRALDQSNHVIVAGHRASACDSTDAKERADSFNTLFQNLEEELTGMSTLSKIDMLKYADKNNNIKKIEGGFNSTDKNLEDRSKVVEIGDVRVDTEKLKTFFNDGRKVYYHQMDLPLPADLSKPDPRTLQGINEIRGDELKQYKTFGVYSYSRTAAKAAGQKFWNDLCGARKDHSNTKCNPDALLKCDKNSWVRNNEKNTDKPKTFSIKNYVTNSWDESTNCNAYDESKAKLAMGKMNQSIERNSNDPLPCPLVAKKCSALAHAKGEFPDTVNPLCRTSKALDSAQRDYHAYIYDEAEMSKKPRLGKSTQPAEGKK